MTALARRICGDCKACCVAPKIELPELRKEAGVACPHLTGAGCGIYARRPLLCQQFLCGWRLFEELGNDWRPDRCGVLIMQKGTAELPRAFHGAPYGILLVITGGEAAIRRPALAEYAARLMARGIPVYMGVISPVILLNEHLTGREDVTVLRQRMLELFPLLDSARWGTLRKIAFRYRLQLDRAQYRLSKPKK